MAMPGLLGSRIPFSGGMLTTSPRFTRRAGAIKRNPPVLRGNDGFRGAGVSPAPQHHPRSVIRRRKFPPRHSRELLLFLRTLERKLRTRGLQTERGKRSVLRGDDELSAIRGCAGAPAERFFGGDARDVGIVVVRGEMRENHVACARVERFRVGQKFAD